MSTTTATTSRAATGWWSESTDDWGGHYGTRNRDGRVRAEGCRRVFTPLTNGPPFPAKVEPLTQPADDEHACPKCLVVWKATVAAKVSD